MFKSSGSFSGHIDAMARNGGARVSAVWSMAEQMWSDNFHVRMQMYKSLVEPCLLYGCEIFGFHEQPQLEKVQRRYLRWTLGLAPWARTSLMIPISLLTGKRAIEYEAQGREGACLLVRECIRGPGRKASNEVHEGKR